MQNFKKTIKQVEAIDLLSQPLSEIMLYGGSRSGKTFIICYALIIRCLKECSRHLAVRLRFNHIKTSLWMDTIPRVLDLCFPSIKDRIKPDNVDYFLKFPNGSELWIAGLDDKTRTEKILGKEYSTIFFNEASQIPYSSVAIAKTRLAQKNNLQKKCYFDENSPEKSHWSYSRFILGKDPDSWEDIDNSKLGCLLMNPEDNKENIDENYIKDILDNLPSKERDRFKYGIFGDAAEGAVYYGFKRERNVEEFEYKITPPKIGTDFNVSPITSCFGFYENDIIYIWDEVYKMNSNTFELAEIMKSKWKLCDLYPDSTGNARKTCATKTDHQILRDAGFNLKYNPNPHVKDRQNNVNYLLEKGRIKIHPRCKMLIKDLEQLTHDNKDPNLSHISDALGYLCYGLVPYIKPSQIKIGSYV